VLDEELESVPLELESEAQRVASEGPREALAVLHAGMVAPRVELAVLELLPLVEPV